MQHALFKENLEFNHFLRWIIFSRVIFAVLLIVSCLVFSLSEKLSFFSQPFLTLYNVAGGILVLSVIYLFWFHQSQSKVVLAYFQTIVDTFIATTIIYVTGCYDSIFTFLYLVVVVYSGMLLLQKGGLIMAALSCVQYGILIELEYYKIITPHLDSLYFSGPVDETRVIYRIVILVLACFSVAILSGFLARQLKGAKQDLKMAQAHLKRVEKMAAMDEMISGIAHEINNPLASLSGSIQMLHEDTAPGSYEDKLMQIILRETGRLESIVKDIRIFAKPGTDNAQEIQMADAIRDTAQLFCNDPQWRNKFNLTMNLDDTIRFVIDPLHFNQILWNLLKNSAQSIKHDGLINITLRLSLNKRIYLTIEDNGIGIDPKDAGHIFDPFYTSKPDGTGLGLSIIHRIVDTYNGMIDFESAPGQGSIFTILFSTQSRIKT